MGLKNYHEQKANLSKIDNVINKLANYAKTLDANYMTIVQDHVVWGNNIDRCQVINRMGLCYAQAAMLEGTLIYLKDNALYCLNQMNKLEKIIHGGGKTQKKQINQGLMSGETPVTAKRNKIFIDLNFFDGGSSFCNVFRNQARIIETFKTEINKIERNVDPELKKNIKNKDVSFAEVKKKIDQLYEYNNSLINMFQIVFDVYNKAENHLMVELERYTIDVNSSGQVNGSIETQQYDKYRQKQNPINWVKARPYISIEDPELYPKQEPKKCTLYTNIYLMSRYSILHGGDPITPENYINYTGKNLWSSSGMADGYNFTVNGETVHVQHCYRNDKYQSSIGVVEMKPEERVEYVKKLLKNHPEGIGAYDHNSNTSGGMHAVLVTGYDEATGEFLIIDPATGGGEVRESQTTTHFKVANIESIYVINSF